MNQKINQLIPKAIDAISDGEMATDGKVEKEYKGYISSMGASILQSGLIATLAFYSKDAEGSGAKRTYLLKAIGVLVVPDNNNSELLKYVLVNPSNQRKIENDISNALIALKLALRTFEQKT